MIPRHRAWDKIHKTMYEVDDIMSIDFGKSEISVKTLFFERTNYYKFDDIVLMQSAGLKDKNGKEIFEGDIIAIEVEDIEAPVNAKVFCNNDIGVLMFHVFEDDEDNPMVELIEDNSVSFAVIGNVWEDGELLDGENTEEN